MSSNHKFSIIAHVCVRLNVRISHHQIHRLICNCYGVWLLKLTYFRHFNVNVIVVCNVVILEHGDQSGI